MILGARILIHYINTGMVTPYIPTAILSAIILIVGFQTIIFGFIAEMISTNRKLHEEMLYRSKKK